MQERETRQYHLYVVYPERNGGVPVFYPTEQGLAEYRDSEKIHVVTVPFLVPQSHEEYETVRDSIRMLIKATVNEILEKTEENAPIELVVEELLKWNFINKARPATRQPTR